MSPTDCILAHWRAITPRGDVEQHEAGMRRVIEAAIYVKVVITPLKPRTVPIENGDEMGVEK